MILLWLSEIRWDYLETRKQHLLKRFNRNWDILFIQPFTLRSGNSWRVRKDGNIRYITVPTFRRGNRLLQLVFNRKIIRSLLYTIISMYTYAMCHVLYKKKPDVICISNVFYIPVLKLFSVCKVWDLNDHPEQFSQLPSWAGKMFNQLMYNNKANIISSSCGLEKWVSDEYGRDSLLIPNGVDIAHFRDHKISKLKNHNAKVLGYVGIISDWFFDFELLELLAEKFPEVQIKIYGPVSSGARRRMNLTSAIGTITFHDKIPYDMLPEIMSTFDVGIIPLRSIEEVWRLASAKLLQYLASGMPVVSVWMEQYQDLPNVFMSKNHSEFLRNIEEVLGQRTLITNNKAILKYDWQGLADKYQDELIRLIAKDAETAG